MRNVAASGNATTSGNAAASIPYVVLFIFLAPLPAAMFLLQDGFFASSDGMIHLYRLFELNRSVHGGVLYPRWFPLSGYGYGLPVFNYYPPLVYYLAELLHLTGAGYIVSLKLVIALGFVVAAFSMFLFACDLLGDAAAFVAGVAYAYLPYLLSDAYVRGNFPEFLAMGLMPLALWTFRRVFESSEPIHAIIAALTFAAIILTHHLTAMLFAGLLLAYLVGEFVTRPQTTDRRPPTADDGQHPSTALHSPFDFAQGMAQDAVVGGQSSAVGVWLLCSAAILVALALSAFYWLPALAELNLVYVGPASVARFLVNRLVSPADFFAPSLVYEYLPQSEALKHSAGFPQTLLALLSIVVLFTQYVIRNTHHATRNTQHASCITSHALFFFFLLVVASIFMMLTISAPLWYAIPILRFLQFPWRVQVLAGIGIAFLLGVWAKWLGERLKPRAAVFAAFAIALVVLALANLPVRAFALSDADLNLLQSDDSDYVISQMGWGWTREFVPATVQEFEAIYAPVAKPTTTTNPAPALPALQIQDDGLLARAFRVSTAQPFELSLHTFFFPGWQGYIDGTPARTYARGTLGLATVVVPSGEHIVSFRFEDTLLRTAANLVSVFASIALVVWLIVMRRRAAIALGVAIVCVSALIAWHTRESPTRAPIAVVANLDNRAMLVGYSDYRVDNMLYVTLHWLALQEMDRDYTSFVHLLSADGAVLAQHDGPTDQGLTPTTRWLAGEIVADRHALALNAIAPGEYRLAAGMYLPLEDGYIGLTVLDQSGNTIGERVELGRVQAW